MASLLYKVVDVAARGAECNWSKEKIVTAVSARKGSGSAEAAVVFGLYKNAASSIHSTSERAND